MMLREFLKRTRIISFTVLLCACASADAVSINGKFVVVQSHDKTIPAESIASIVDRGDRLFPILSEFFGRNIPVPVVIDLGARLKGGRSFADKNMIGFPKRVIDQNIVIIAHEMTHLYMPERILEALREGIAVYVQDRFGEVPGYPNFGKDLDVLLQRQMKNRPDSSIRSFLDAEAFFKKNRRGQHQLDQLSIGKISPADRRDAYIVAGSFTRYLFEVVLMQDMGRFKRIYTSGDFQTVTGKSLSAIQKAWAKHIGRPGI